MNLDSNFVELFAKGYYFDEISGSASTGLLTLTGIADVDNATTLNINLLTTLAKQRILSLIDSGLNFEAARVQAQGEVLSAFGITSSLHTSFEEMSMLEEGSDNAVLLTISSTMMMMAHKKTKGLGSVPSMLFGLISFAAADLQDNGKIDEIAFLTLWSQAVLEMDRENVRQNFELRFPGIVVPDFEEIIEGIINDVIYKNWKRYQMAWQCEENCEALDSLHFKPDFVMIVDAYGNISGALDIMGLELTGFVNADGAFDGEIVQVAPIVTISKGNISGLISETGDVSGTYYFDYSDPTYNHSGTIFGQMMTDLLLE